MRLACAVGAEEAVDPEGWHTGWAACQLGCPGRRAGWPDGRRGGAGGWGRCPGGWVPNRVSKPSLVRDAGTLTTAALLRAGPGRCADQWRTRVRRKGRRGRVGVLPRTSTMPCTTAPAALPRAVSPLRGRRAARVGRRMGRWRSGPRCWRRSRRRCGRSSRGWSGVSHGWVFLFWGRCLLRELARGVGWARPCPSAASGTSNPARRPGAERLRMARSTRTTPRPARPDDICQHGPEAS